MVLMTYFEFDDVKDYHVKEIKVFEIGDKVWAYEFILCKVILVYRIIRNIFLLLIYVLRNSLIFQCLTILCIFSEIKHIA